MAETCEHQGMIQGGVEAESFGCEECIKRGDEWVHLRICMTCGRVGCCDSSKNRHARRHARTAHHPIIQSFEPGELWLYCFPDELMLPAAEKLYRPPVSFRA
jgi:uncharacterized UBP type Zn finger protein